MVITIITNYYNNTYVLYKLTNHTINKFIENIFFRLRKIFGINVCIYIYI